MPALLTRMSTPPNAATVAATPALTASSLQTSITTLMASPLRPRISAATASAAAWFRSAMATLAPSRANVSAISLPMPLAAPVTMADLFWSFMSAPSWGEIVVDDRAQPKSQVGHDVHAAEDLAHRQRRHRRERVVEQLQRRRSLPGALHRDVLHVIADELADAGAAVDVRNDLQQVVRRAQRRQDRLVRQRSVLVTHRRHGDGNGAVLQHTEERVLLDPQLRPRQLL